MRNDDLFDFDFEVHLLGSWSYILLVDNFMRFSVAVVYLLSLPCFLLNSLPDNLTGFF
jgi:hypothetical protein